MLCLDLLLASISLVQPVDAAPLPEAAPAPAPAPALAGEPTVEPTPEPEPAPTVETVPLQPAPAPAQSPPQPPYERPTPPPRKLPPPQGVGSLVAGPLLVLTGVPFSLLGNAMWRNNCGPNSSGRECFDGTVGSVGMHTLASAGYGLGIALTGMGARKHASDSVSAGRDPDAGTLIVAGSALLPLGLVSMGMARLFFWLPTPECLEYSCVQRLQTYSTITVAGSAVIATAGAGLLMYGIGIKRTRRSQGLSLSLSPRFSRGSAGFDLTGRF